MLASPSARPAGIKRERDRKVRCPGPHGFSQRSAALRRWLLVLMSTVWLWVMLTLMGVPPPAVTNYWHFPALHLFHTMTTAASNASFTRLTAPAQRNAPAFQKTHSSFTAFNGSEPPSIANIFKDFGYAPAQQNAPAIAIAHSSFTAFIGSAVLCGDSLLFSALERHDTTRHDTTHEMPPTSPSFCCALERRDATRHDTTHEMPSTSPSLPIANAGAFCCAGA